MPTHDPSTCPRCRWAAEREGWYQEEEPGHVAKDGTLFRAWFDKDDKGYYELPSFCPSLDAVAGLMKEMDKGDKDPWCLHWDDMDKVWLYFREGVSPRWGVGWFDQYRSPEDLPGACVIEAAMQVLEKKESDD